MPRPEASARRADSARSRKHDRSGDVRLPKPPVAAVRRALLTWFARHARELPWRPREARERTLRARGRTATVRRDPWRVWVSEIMLQQTRVEAVVEPYARFLATFPTLASLARAGESDVLARWSGLGYYRRARSLHAGARHVVEHHRGEVPRTRAELEKIPGVGPYTAGALLSIAFGQREPAVDANVARVVARVFGIADSRCAAGRAEVARLAADLVACERPGDVNEALMDLGSAVCTARIARCEVCPVARMCRARATGDAVEIAGPRARKVPRQVELACAVVRDGDRVLFLRRPHGDALLGGLWDLPTVESIEPGTDPSHALRLVVRSRAGLDARLEGPLVSVRHEIVGRKIRASVYAAGVRRGRRSLPPEARMLASEEMEEVGLPALPVKILRALGRHWSARSS